MRTKNVVKLGLLTVTMGSLIGCNNSGSNNGSSNSPSTSSANVIPLSTQLLTTSSIGIVTQSEDRAINASNFSAQADTSCYQMVSNLDGTTYAITKSSSEWWSTAQLTFAVRNTCNNAQAANNQQVLIKNFKMNGKNVTSVGDIAQQGSPWLTTSSAFSGSNLGVFFTTSPCEGQWCDWAKIPAGGVKTFSVNISNSGPINTVTVDSVTIPNGPQPTVEPTVTPTVTPTVQPTVTPTITPTVAPTTEPTVTPTQEPTTEPTVEPTIEPTVTPAITGNLDITLDTVALVEVCKTTACNIKLNVVAPSGQQLDSMTITPNANPNTYVEYKNLLPGNYTFSIDQSTLPAGSTTKYSPVNGVTAVQQGQTAEAGVVVSYTQPEQLGNINVSLANVNGSNFADLGLINGTITDMNDNKAYPFTIKLNGSYSLSNVPANHQYRVKVQGIANAKAGTYYSPITQNDILVENNKTKNVSLAYTTQPTTYNVTFTISGDAISTNPSIRFTDAASDYRFVETNTVANGNVFKFPNASPVAVTLADVAGFTVTTTPKPLVLTQDLTNVSLVYAKDVVQTAYFSYLSPFKDYNNKVVLTVAGVTTPVSSVTFTSNFQAKAGWGNCFGTQVDNLNFNTNKVGNKYVTTISPKVATTNLSLTQTCDIFGTDSGNAIVLPGVVDAIVYNFEGTRADKSSFALDMQRPCTANGCKDPGNGYVNAGYYAQWSVWGRKYNPYNMPFDNINDIIYAFVGFDKTNGNIFSLDKDADGWGMSATSRALRQYPYMQAHLSFGGWTNNGLTTAPMFEDLASSQASMDNFTAQSIELLRKTGFTGIDIDWEWWSDYKDNQAPAKKMLQFFKTLRAGLDKASAEDGRKYTLTIAVNGSRDRVTALENPVNPNSVSNFWSQVGGLMDHINVMNYDYHGSFDVGPAYFQANYDFANVPAQYATGVGVTTGTSVKDSMNAYVASGVDSRKLVLGIPLYARTMKVAESANGGLFATVQGAGYGDYEGGVLDYKCLINPIVDPVTGCGSAGPIAGITSTAFYSTTSNVALFNTYGRDALQPWGYSASTNSFVTYDDRWSATAKASKAIETNLGGTMYWELDGDSLDPTKSIIQAVKDRYNS